EVVGVVEAGTGDFHAKTNQRIDTVLARHPARVVVQLVARREYPRPVGVLLERKRIGKRGDVDGDTRIAVIAPGAADILAAFENQDVVDTIGAQLDGNTDTGNAGANDDDLVVRDDGLCACRSGKGGHVHAGASLTTVAACAGRSADVLPVGARCRRRALTMMPKSRRASGSRKVNTGQTWGRSARSRSCTGTPASRARWATAWASSRRHSSALTVSIKGGRPL